MFGAVDIGGTKTLLATFSSEGELVDKFRFETPKDYKVFISELGKALGQLKPAKYKIVTVAAPGEVDRNRGVVPAFGNLPWQNTPIRDDIEKVYKCPALVENDARLAGLSEALLLKYYRKVLYITISTGINGGLIIDGSISPDFETMELGQMLFEHDGKLERWESFASGRAIVQEFGKPAKDIVDPRAWYIIAHNIAIGLIDLIASMTPDIIVIGGGVGSHFNKFKDRLNEDLQNYTNDLLVLPPIVGAKRPEDAVIYGCYDLGKVNYDRLS